MTLVKYNRNNPFDIFENFFGDVVSARTEAGNKLISPQVNVSETEKALFVEAQMPGVEEKDIDVNLEKNILTIKAEHEKNNEDKKHHRREFSYEAFERVLTIPENVDKEAIKAIYKNGILNITLPKLKKEVFQKKIEVKSV